MHECNNACNAGLQCNDYVLKKRVSGGYSRSPTEASDEARLNLERFVVENRRCFGLQLLALVASYRPKTTVKSSSLWNINRLVWTYSI